MATTTPTMNTISDKEKATVAMLRKSCQLARYLKREREREGGRGREGDRGERERREGEWEWERGG